VPYRRELCPLDGVEKLGHILMALLHCAISGRAEFGRSRRQ
jgi:hypothetical protein